METRIFHITEQNMDEAALAEAGEILQKGGLVAFPTETVYGLGGDALNPDSARRIYEAKGRPSDNPLIVHICRIEDMYPIVREVTPRALAIAEAFWPGPLTLILEKSDRVPYETTGGLDTVAVRMPSHPVAAELIRCGGGYIAAPIANLSGKPSPTLAKYVVQDMDGRIDAVIDGGEVGIGLESTIIDLTVEPPQILRPGYITREMLEQVLGQVDVDAAILEGGSDLVPKAPGMKYRHYAPRGDLTILSGEESRVVDFINKAVQDDARQGHKVGIICTDETAGLCGDVVIKTVGARKDEESIARRLYGILREFDDEQVTRIYSEDFESDGLGQAIMNRLLKAAGHRIMYV